MDDQAEKLRQKLQKLSPQHTAKTIAIVSGKGGVGKSNIALNFALSLTRNEKKVLLIDLDIGMGNIDVLLGKTSTYSIVNMFENNLSIYDIIEVGPLSLSYIAGGNGQDHIFYLTKQKFQYFLTQLEQLFSEYDYIIFDMGAGITRETIHFILAVDECFLVTTPEPTSLTDAYSMIKHIVTRQPLQFHLIINRSTNYKQGIQLTNRMIDTVKRFLHQDIVPLGIIPDDRDVTDSVLKQQPFLLHKPRSKASLAIRNMTQQILGEVSKTTNDSGFLSKIKKLITER